jgi:hypothetical protein
MSEPSKYSGNRNHEVFLQWLNQFLNWLRSHYYCGDEADVSRLNLLGNYVDGIAAYWYAANIDNPERISTEPMSFIDAICAMHRRFVGTATANNAVTQYDRIEYNPADGVEGFYYKLDKMASRMVERPSNYSFKLRLFEGLPSWIYDILLERNRLPEFCNLEDIQENARQIEEMRLHAHGPTRTNGITNAIPACLNSSKQNRNRMSNNDSTSRHIIPMTSKENRPNNNNNRSSGPKPPMVSSTRKAFNPCTTNNYLNRNVSNNKPSGSGPYNVAKNTEVECYNCGHKGHIASNPKCPKYHLRQQRPRLNAQQLVDGDDQDADEDKNDEPHLEVASEHGNSWGGSQYEPDDKSDEHEFVQQDEEEPEEEQNASEEEPDVQIATMYALWMHTMCKITEPHPEITEPNIADIEDIIPNTHEPSSVNEGSSNIGVTHIELSVEQLDNSRQSPTPEREDHNTRQFRNELSVVHSYLYESEAEISDPISIEYRDGLIFREEPRQDMDQFIEAARRNNCRLCNNCQPLVRIHRFVGSDSEHYYYYCIYTCRTPVERDWATEEISDDEDLNVERFFSARIIRSPSPSSSINEELMTADNLSWQQDLGDDDHPESPTGIPALVDVVIESESVGYIDDPPERSNWTFTMTAGSVWDVPVDTEINRSDITWYVCHKCSPRIVAVYCNTDGGTWFIWFQQVCRNTATWQNTEAIADSSKPDHMSDPPSKTEERDCEGADILPDLIPITDGEEITSEQEHVTENVPDESSSSNIDEDNDTHPDEILECPYCHNCEPRTEPAYYFCSDGKVFYRERLICQADKDNESPARSSLHAMHMVYSSNVRRKTTSRSCCDN